ncbi:MAG: hypothetical protein ACK5KT_12630 [Dysgonomonas sp.]
MKPESYAKLEKDYSFKRSYLNNTPWWKNILMVPPILLLFVGLAGILYLFHLDKLVSLYILPYLVLFVIGTVLLKATKKHIQKTKMTVPESFRVCLAKPIWEKSGLVYTIYANDTHRHNKHYINNLVNKISADEFAGEHGSAPKDKSLLIHDNENNADYYLRIFEAKNITKRNQSWREEYLFPILHIDDKYTFIIKKKDLSFYGE